jgi:hypothetical protein
MTTGTGAVLVSDFPTWLKVREQLNAWCELTTIGTTEGASGL